MKFEIVLPDVIVKIFLLLLFVLTKNYLSSTVLYKSSAFFLV